MGFMSEIGVLLKGFNELNAPLLEAESSLLSFKDTAQSTMLTVNSDMELGTVDTGSLDEASVQMEELGLRSEEASSRLEDMGAKTDETAVKLEDMGAESGTTSVQLDELGAESAAASEQLDEVGKKSYKASVNLESMGKKAMLAGAALAAGLGYAVDKSMDFDTAMTEVDVLLGASASQMDILKGNVKGLSREIGALPTETAGTLATVIKGGFREASAATKLLEGSMRLADASYGDMGDTAASVIPIMNAYEVQAEGITNVSDQFIVAAQMGKTSVTELAGSLRKVAPLASSAGVGLNELLSATSTLSGVMSTTEAVSSLRGVLSAINDPGKEALETARQLGIDFSATAVKSMGLANWLEDVKVKTGGSDEAMTKLFGPVKVLQGVFALTGSQAEKYSNILDQVTNSSGATAEAFEKVNASAGDAMGDAKANLQGMLISIGDVLLPSVAKIAGFFSDAAVGVSEFAEEHPLLMKFAVTLAVVAAGVLLVGGAALVMSGMVTTAMAAVHVSTGGVLLAVGALVAGITGLVMLFTSGTDEMGEGTGTFSRILGGLKDAFYAVATPVAFGVGFLVGVFLNAWDVISDYTAEVWPLIKEVALSAFGPLIDFVGFGADLIQTYITTAWEVIKVVSEAVWDGIALTVTTVWTSIYKSLALVLNLITGVFKAGLQLLTGDWAGAWESVQETFSAAWENIKNIFFAWLNWQDGLKDIFNEAGEGLINAFWEGIQSAWGTLKEGFTDLLGGLRALLPGSDAEEGPLSQLTASGRALLPTFSRGIQQNADAPALAVSDSLNSISLEAPRMPSMEATSTERAGGRNSSSSSNEDRGFTVIFQKGAIQLENNSGNSADLFDDLEDRLTEILARAALRLGVQNA